MSSSTSDTIELAKTFGFVGIGVTVVLGMEPHTPTATEDLVVRLDQSSERVPRRWIELLDRECHAATLRAHVGACEQPMGDDLSESPG